jgi:hypothetical protein
MRVLIACEYSGIVRDAFIRLGHDAMSCDLLPTESRGPHYQGSVFDIIGDGWDMMIAHPPCTYLSYVATRHWNDPGRDILRNEAAEFFMRLYNAPISKVCIENPVGWMNTIWQKPSQIIHPYYFGEDVQKRTCLWLRGLPLLTHPAPKTLTKPKPIFYLKTTGKPIHWTEANHGGHKRSKTFRAVAEAMANQWGRYL